MASKKSNGVNHNVIQCFSHWTFQRTNKHLQVVDCQGVFDSKENTFVLSDPAIHCVDKLKFGGTNLAKAGFRRFFKTHKCNELCVAIELVPLTDFSEFD